MLEYDRVMTIGMFVWIFSVEIEGNVCEKRMWLSVAAYLSSHEMQCASETTSSKSDQSQRLYSYF